MKIVKPSEISRKNFDLLDAMHVVFPIIQEVRKQGDRALLNKGRLESVDSIVVSSERINNAKAQVSKDIVKFMQLVQRHISIYQTTLLPKEWAGTIAPGILAGQLIRPLSRVGCYIPGEGYPSISNILMATVTAKIAGVHEIIVCTPRATPEMLVACDLAGVNLICEIGGARAIAAMAYGTQSIPNVDKIVGSGNRYVMAAKKIVYGDVGIDFLSGPREIFIIADDTGDPAYIAGDLIAHVESNCEGMTILATPSRTLAEKVIAAIHQQLKTLPNQGFMRRSLNINGKIVLTSSLDEAFELSNRLAPEHVLIHLEDVAYLDKVRNAGAVYLGKNSAKVFGDYAVGPNHILPTGGFATFQSSLTVHHFLKALTIQQLEKEGVRSMGSTVAALARLEGLEGHARAAEMRFKHFNKNNEV